MHGRKPVLWEAIHALVGGELSGSSNYDTFIYHNGQTPPTKEEANKCFISSYIKAVFAKPINSLKILLAILTICKFQPY